nr:uncharacterized protein LOC113734999 isoform X1 [Coffea arabica]
MQNLFFLLELNITLDNHHKGGSLSLSAVSSITYTMLSPSSIQMRSVSSIQWHASPCPGTPVSTSTKVIRYRRLVPEPLPLSVVKTDKRFLPKRALENPSISSNDLGQLLVSSFIAGALQ